MVNFLSFSLKRGQKSPETLSLLDIFSNPPQTFFPIFLLSTYKDKKYPRTLKKKIPNSPWGRVPKTPRIATIFTPNCVNFFDLSSPICYTLQQFNPSKKYKKSYGNVEGLTQKSTPLHQIINRAWHEQAFHPKKSH